MDAAALPYMAYAALLRAGAVVPYRVRCAAASLIAQLALFLLAAGPVLLLAVALAALPALAALGDAANHVVSLARAG